MIVSSVSLSQRNITYTKKIETRLLKRKVGPLPPLVRAGNEAGYPGGSKVTRAQKALCAHARVVCSCGMHALDH